MPKTKEIVKPNTNFNTVEMPGVSPQKSKKRVIISRIKRKILHHVWLLRGFIITLFLILMYGLFLLTSFWARRTGLDFYFYLVKDFIFTPPEKIESQDARTNIVILGRGGAGHDAPDLTDTIIFASINLEDPAVSLISLPRDIWMPELRAKLNSVYYWGNQKQPGGGIVLAKATIEEVVGQVVHYAIVVDFNGFRKVIETLGGVEVEVENAFVDDRYPIPGRENDLCGGDPEYNCRYETIRFEKGRQYMNGETSLKFVRSRNAEGDEGTDLARGKRQQKVIQAIKDKVLTREILLSPKKLLALKDVALESIETDITPSAFAILTRRLLQSQDKIESHVLSEDFLENPPKSSRYDNLYVFLPKDGDWKKVHEWVSCILKKEKCN